MKWICAKQINFLKFSSTELLKSHMQENKYLGKRNQNSATNPGMKILIILYSTPLD